MIRDHSDPNAPYIVIERVQPSRLGRSRFFVNLVFASGARRVMWQGLSYERAILKAEELAREGRGGYPSPLLVDDRILTSPRL